MRARKTFIKFSFLLAAVFVAVDLLLYPIWSDLHAYLGGVFPLMQVLALLGGGYLAYCIYLLRSQDFGQTQATFRLIAMSLADAVMLGLLFWVFWKMGAGSVLMIRSLTQNLGAVLGVAAVFVFLWYWPRWRPLPRRMRALLIAVLAVCALLWISLPLQVRFDARPAVFMQQDGVTVAWGTNMLSSYAITYGDTPAMGHVSRPQEHGLRVVGEGLGSTFLGGYPTQNRELYFQVTVDGVRQIKRSSSVKGGQTVSPVIHVTFPPEEDDDLFLVAFSDIHEMNFFYEQLARHIPWAQVDYALYLGDFVNDEHDVADLAENMIRLPTGGRDIPRVFARGNHEARGPGARALSDVFLPPGGQWYFTFSQGDIFFIVLDSGEDKLDAHVEYAGLVDFVSYHQEQAAWLEAVFSSPAYRQAAQRVVLVHIPPFAVEHQSPAFAPVLDALRSHPEIDLVMSGHIHKGGIWPPEETGWPFPIVTCGGPLGVDSAAVMVQLTPAGMQVQVIDIFGRVIDRLATARQ